MPGLMIVEGHAPMRETLKMRVADLAEPMSECDNAATRFIADRQTQKLFFSLVISPASDALLHEIDKRQLDREEQVPGGNTHDRSKSVEND
jgi:hypothetical protein